MISKVLVPTLVLAALICSRAEASDLTLYKTIDLCGDGFHASQLLAKATDQDLAIALQYMKDKGVDASPYCYVIFYKDGKTKLIDFHPIKFDPGYGVGSPSPDIPSFSVYLDDISHQVTRGHYVK